MEIPFIIISGTIGEDEAVTAMKMGASDYLLKDRLGRLELAVSHALAQSKMLRDQKEANAALRESEERLREVVQNIEEVFWMTNIEKNNMLSTTYSRLSRVTPRFYPKKLNSPALRRRTLNYE